MKKDASKIEKKSFKDLIYGYIILFSFCCMLFIFEPLSMYGSNKDDFWFDLGIMIKPVLGIFAIFFFGSAALLTGLYFLSRRFSKKGVPYNTVLCVLSALFFPMFVQGTVLTSKLPALDGSEIEWDSYTAEMWISIAVFAVFAVGCVVLCVKFGTAKTAKFSAFASVPVFLMLTLMFTFSAFGNKIFESKNNIVCLSENFNTASLSKNFYIFMLDSQNAAMFSEVLDSEPELRAEFNDFTYFTDALSVYAYTRDSVPMILSGKVNKNEKSFGDYSSEALNNSELFKMLDKKGYQLDLYSNELSWYGKKDFDIANAPSASHPNIKFDEFFGQEMRFIWFKYLPYGIKQLSGIEKMDFNRTVDNYKWGNVTLYNEIKNNELTLSNKPQFKFIHVEGPHVPFDLDEDFNKIEKGSYYQKGVASAKLTAAFLDRLRESGVYSNSVIIIMADHGYTYTEDNLTYILKRFNPVLLIKGAGENHDLVESDLPVSYYDLTDAYKDLLAGKWSTELFEDIPLPRERTVLWYEIYSEEHMVEYVTNSNAKDWESFEPSGNVYDLG